MLYALVEFLEGYDKGQRSVVPFDWIKNVQRYEDELMSKKEVDIPETVLVEWHGHIPGRKKTKETPWPVYKAKVLHVAANEKSLQNTLAEMGRREEQQGQGSKRAPKPNLKYVEEAGGMDHSKKKPSHCPLAEEGDEERPGPSKKKIQKRSADQEMESGEGITKKKAGEIQAEANAKLWEEKKFAQFQRTVKELREENFQLKEKVSDLQEIICTHIPQIKDDIAFLAGRERPVTGSTLQSHPVLIQPSSTPGRVVELTAPAESSRPPCPERAPESTQKMEIMKGSGIYCNRATWMSANSTTTCTQMVRQLLIGVFSIEELLESSLSGGVSKRGGEGHFKALEHEKKNAIIEVTMKRFPQATKGVLGSAINGKLTELRRSHKKK